MSFFGDTLYIYEAYLLLSRIACTECKDAAYCYRCFVVCVGLSVVLGRRVSIYSNGPVGPVNRAVLGGDQDPTPRGRGNFFGGGAPMRCGLSSQFYDHLLIMIIIITRKCE